MCYVSLACSQYTISASPPFISQAASFNHVQWWVYASDVVVVRTMSVAMKAMREGLRERTRSPPPRRVARMATSLARLWLEHMRAQSTCGRVCGCAEDWMLPIPSSKSGARRRGVTLVISPTLQEKDPKGINVLMNARHTTQHCVRASAGHMNASALSDDAKADPLVSAMIEATERISLRSYC